MSKEETVNIKMQIVKEFFNIDDEYIAKLLNREEITKNYDYSKLSVSELILLTKDLELSLEILYEIFCVENKDTVSLKKLLMIYRTNGIIRRVDELGRIVLPIEQRNHLHICEKDPLELTLNFQGNFVLKPIKKCVSCGRTKNIVENNGIYMCDICINKYYNKSI